MTPTIRSALTGLAALLLAATTACLDSTSSCSQSNQPGVVVTVVDARNGQFIADSATGTASDGSYSENLVVGVPGQSLQGVFDRAGNYTITVSRPGFLDWSVTNVAISKGECHPNTMVLTAQMQTF